MVMVLGLVLHINWEGVQDCPRLNSVIIINNSSWLHNEDGGMVGSVAVPGAVTDGNCINHWAALASGPQSPELS